MRFLPYGDHAVLAELDEPRFVPAVRAAAAQLDGVSDAVAGARTVLVVCEPSALARVRAALDAADFAADGTQDAARSVDLPVVYDGVDLDEVAAEVDLSADAVVRLHAQGEYVVRFCGFSPGFAYLDGLDPRLHVSRRTSPRTSVPAGSVGMAGEFTGVYPRSSPGGWRLLGRTDATLWDVASDPPALLTPGTRVRFVRA